MSSTSTGRKHFVLGSRDSELALRQTREVQAALQAAFPDCTFEIKTSATYGDEMLGESLKALAAKSPGLFTKKLEVWLLAGECDIAVHSLKDMPTRLPEGLALAAITKVRNGGLDDAAQAHVLTVVQREDPADAAIFHPKHKELSSLADLPVGALVGTSSVRRAAMLRRLHPHLKLVDIRGNLQTRMRKLREGHEGVAFDAILLAMAGLNRLGWQEHVSQILHPATFFYGVGQGALGIECRSDDTDVLRMARAVEHAPSAACCLAERAMLRGLLGGCQVPVGARCEATADGARVRLTGCVLSEDGQTYMEASGEGAAVEAEAVGKRVADELRAMGGAAMIGEGEERPVTYGCAEERAD